jgi:hypothetical protein
MLPDVTYQRFMIHNIPASASAAPLVDSIWRVRHVAGTRSKEP